MIKTTYEYLEKDITVLSNWSKWYTLIKKNATFANNLNLLEGYFILKNKIYKWGLEKLEYIWWKDKKWPRSK